MKKFQLLVVSFFVFNLSWSQTHVGLTGSLHYGYRNLDGDQNLEWLIENRDSRESPAFGFDIGVSAFHDFENRNRLTSGIRYVRFSDNIQDMYLQTQTDFSEENKFKYGYDYISVPITWGYRFGNETISITPSIGVYNQFALRMRTVSKIEWNEGGTDRSTSSSFGNESPLARYNLALTSSISVDVKLSEQFKLRIAPTGLLMVSPLVMAPLNQRNFSAGLELGVHYRLKS